MIELKFKEEFVPLIQSGSKIHTIRKGIKTHYEAGMKFGFFGVGKDGNSTPFEVDGRHVHEIVSVQDLEMCAVRNKVNEPLGGLVLLIDSSIIHSDYDKADLIEGDGFGEDAGDFFALFFPNFKVNRFEKEKDFKLDKYKLVHWTPKSY